MAGIVVFGETRAAVQYLVDAGFFTPADADEVAELIDMVTAYVDLGAISREEGDALIINLAEEKVAEYRDRAGLEETRTQHTAAGFNGTR